MESEPTRGVVEGLAQLADIPDAGEDAVLELVSILRNMHETMPGDPKERVVLCLTKRQVGLLIDDLEEGALSRLTADRRVTPWR